VEDDQIIAVNNYKLDNNLDKWLNYFVNDEIIITILRNNKILNLKLNKENDNQYFNYKFSKT